MYADDTSLCHQSGDLTQLEEAINSDLKQLTTWLQGNKLSLNVAKTHSEGQITPRNSVRDSKIPGISQNFSKIPGILPNFAKDS